MTLRVAQITDTHLTAETDSGLHGINTTQSLRKTVTKLKELYRVPDAIIATGDIAEDGSKSTYKHFQELLAESGIPVYVLPGNHDDLDAMRNSFSVDDFFCSSTARIQDWGFIFVNSQVRGYSHGFVALDELEKDILALKGLPILVSLHHTPTHVCPSFGCQLQNSTEFTELLNSYSDIKGVIAGHTHNAHEINTGGHVQFTTPSTFAHATHAQSGDAVDHDDFWASHSLDGSLQGFRILDLFPEGSIQSEVHWL